MSGKWQELNQWVEFKNDVFCKEFVRDGKKVKLFLIKRSNFRAPFYGIAEIEIQGKAYKGYCTSISVGGCFVEFTKIDESLMKMDESVLVHIKAKPLTKGVYVRAIIRCIFNNKRARGLGVKFEELGAQESDVINAFIEQYVALISKKAIA